MNKDGSFKVLLGILLVVMLFLMIVPVDGLVKIWAPENDSPEPTPTYQTMPFMPNAFEGAISPMSWNRIGFDSQYANWFQIEVDEITGRWVDYGDSQLYVFPPMDVPPLESYVNGDIPGYVEIEGIRFQTYDCFSNNPLCNYELMRVSSTSTWDSSQVVENLSIPPTQVPTITPTPTDKYIVVDMNVEVKVLYRGVDSNGNVKDLNERSTPSLYNFSDGYRLPYCDTMPEDARDLTECSQNTTKLYYVIQIVSGLPYDIGYWGMVAPDVWMALYVEKTDTWYTDWRPPTP